MNYKIYTTYHKDSIIKEYNLKSDNYHILFPTHKNIKGDNINYFSKYLNEYCTMYYVWKNNLYSDFVGFEHYSKRFDITKIPDLKDDEIYVSMYEINRDNTLNDDKNWLLDLPYYEKNIKLLYGENNKYIDYLYNCHNIIWNECIIMNFTQFCKMMKFIDQLVNMFDNDIHGDYTYNNYLIFYNNDNYLCRAHIIERLISMWIICNYDNSKIYVENK